MKKVVVGMSGGVDSSVAAYLLKEKGYEVIGVTMETWLEDGQDSNEAIEDARKIANQLGIAHYVVDFKNEFKEHVIDYFVGEYLQARTPNPCIACNRYVKWESLLEKALELGADYIATGHYARIVKLENGRYSIRNSMTAEKDQSYALFNLNQKQLAHTLMPVGEYEKEEIRQIAHKVGLAIADKPDSQDICFIPDNDYKGFISAYLLDDANKNKIDQLAIGKNTALEAGNFILADSTVVGRHKGLMNYTVGQRKGIDVFLGHPVFVLELRPESNEVVIGKSDEVFKDYLYANKINFMSIEKLEGEMEVIAKVRYNHKGAKCIIKKISEDVVLCEFSEAQRAITPGQAVVFYENDYLVGGGTIMANNHNHGKTIT